MTLEQENEELKALVRRVYWWTKEMPVKHPQQLEWREQARKYVEASESLLPPCDI